MPTCEANLTEVSAGRNSARPNARCWHIADVPLARTNVCFERKNGHAANGPLCLLMTQSGLSSSAQARAQNSAVFQRLQGDIGDSKTPTSSLPPGGTPQLPPIIFHYQSLIAGRRRVELIARCESSRAWRTQTDPGRRRPLYDALPIRNLPSSSEIISYDDPTRPI